MENIFAVLSTSYLFVMYQIDMRDTSEIFTNGSTAVKNRTFAHNSPPLCRQLGGRPARIL